MQWYINHTIRYILLIRSSSDDVQLKNYLLFFIDSSKINTYFQNSMICHKRLHNFTINIMSVLLLKLNCFNNNLFVRQVFTWLSVTMTPICLQSNVIHAVLSTNNAFTGVQKSEWAQWSRRHLRWHSTSDSSYRSNRTITTRTTSKTTKKTTSWHNFS